MAELDLQFGIWTLCHPISLCREPWETLLHGPHFDRASPGHIVTFFMFPDLLLHFIVLIFKDLILFLKEPQQTETKRTGCKGNEALSYMLQIQFISVMQVVRPTNILSPKPLVCKEIFALWLNLFCILREHEGSGSSMSPIYFCD